MDQNSIQQFPAFSFMNLCQSAFLLKALAMDLVLPRAPASSSTWEVRHTASFRLYASTRIFRIWRMGCLSNLLTNCFQIKQQIKGFRKIATHLPPLSPGYPPKRHPIGRFFGCGFWASASPPARARVISRAVGLPISRAQFDVSARWGHPPRFAGSRVA